MKKTRVTTGRRQWTADEHADLWRLKCEGVQLSEIARRLGRDLSSCFGRLKKTDDQRHYWSPCCSIGCNGESRLRELGWTIEQSFQVMNRGCVAKMVRNVFDMHEFELCLKKLANDEVDRLQRLLDTFSV